MRRSGVLLCVCATTLALGTLSLHAATLKPDAWLENSAETLNHSLMLVRSLETLLTLGNASDVTLRVETLGSDEVRVVRAHALVLTLQSHVFDQLLRSRNSSVLVLQETPECAALFHAFIRYLYSGDLTLRLNQAVPLHTLARKYGVRELQRGVAHYMTLHLSSHSPAGHVVSWHQYASQTGEASLRESCEQYLSWNLSALLHGPEWSSVSHALLLHLLRRSDLVLSSELELYQALEVWAGQRGASAEAVESALREIRYAMIPPQQLFLLQKTSQLMLQHQEMLRDLLLTAFQFHAATPRLLAKHLDMSRALFTPRNYLSGAWGAAWVINSPARDDRSFSFQTQISPAQRITWNALFSPRWLSPAHTTGPAHPRLLITPASSGPDLAGVGFQKSVVVSGRAGGRVAVRHVFDFHQSSEEAGHFLQEAELQRRGSDYLIDGSLHLHLIVKPLYHNLIVDKK